MHDIFGRCGIDPRFSDPHRHLLLHAGDADLKELVEIGATDGHKKEPLHKRGLGIPRLSQYTSIKLEETESLD